MRRTGSNSMRLESTEKPNNMILVLVPLYA